MERNTILRKVRDNDWSKDTVQSISPQWKKVRFHWSREKNYRKLQMVSATGVLSHGVMLIYNLGQRKQLNQL